MLFGTLKVLFAKVGQADVVMVDSTAWLEFDSSGVQFNGPVVLSVEHCLIALRLKFLRIATLSLSAWSFLDMLYRL